MSLHVFYKHNVYKHNEAEISKELSTFLRQYSCNSVTITNHQRNLRALATEQYKISNNLSPLFMRDMMTDICAPYNMRSTTKVEKDDNGNLQCTNKSNYEIPGIKTVS